MSPPRNCSFSPMMWQLPTVNSAHSGSLVDEVDLYIMLGIFVANCLKPLHYWHFLNFCMDIKSSLPSTMVTPEASTLYYTVFTAHCTLCTLYTVMCTVTQRYHWYDITFYCRSRLVPHTLTDDPVLTYYSSYWLLLRAHHLNRTMWIAQHRIHLCLLCLTCWLSLL